MHQPMKRGRERAANLIESAGYGSVHKHLAAGGEHSDFAEDAKMIKSAFEQHDKQLHGGKKTRLHFRDGGHAEGGMAEDRLDRRPRRADGGGAGKGGKGKDAKHRPSSQVNVVISPHSGQPGMGGPMAMGTPPMPPPHPPMMAAPPPGAPPMPPPHPPMGMPPGAGPGMPPPGMVPPGMPPGGMPPRPMIKTGGRAYTAGSGSGEGRLQKAERLGRRDK